MLSMEDTSVFLAPRNRHDARPWLASPHHQRPCPGSRSSPMLSMEGAAAVLHYNRNEGVRSSVRPRRAACLHRARGSPCSPADLCHARRDLRRGLTSSIFGKTLNPRTTHEHGRRARKSARPQTPNRPHRFYPAAYLPRASPPPPNAAVLFLSPAILVLSRQRRPLSPDRRPAIPRHAPRPSH
jgi:hypothetical protein